MITRAPASDTAPGDALVESIRSGRSEPIIEPQRPHPAAQALHARACSANQTSSILPAVEERSSPDYPEIQLWTLQRGEWRRSDRLQVDPSNPSLLERVAQKNLYSLSPKQCFPAATVDGSNAVFMIHKDEEEKLRGEGWLERQKDILSMASQLINRFEDGIVENQDS
ncbi:unnamed protein product [Penicillium pancosmium]